MPPIVIIEEGKIAGFSRAFEEKLKRRHLHLHRHSSVFFRIVNRKCEDRTHDFLPVFLSRLGKAT